MAATVMARATGSAAMTPGYRGDGGGGNEDEDNSKGKSGETGNVAATTEAATLISVLFHCFRQAHDTGMRFVFLLDA